MLDWILILALLKPQLYFFYGRAKGNRTLGNLGVNSTEIKLSTISHPPIWVSENSFSWGPKKLTPKGNRRELGDLLSDHIFTTKCFLSIGAVRAHLHNNANKILAKNPSVSC